MTLKELLKSKDYKESNLKIVEIEGEFAIAIKNSSGYIDLKCGYDSWTNAELVRQYCLGTEDKVVEIALKKINAAKKYIHTNRPLEVKELNVETLKEHETKKHLSYKDKLMEGF
jgi:hypothetical protein